MRKHWITTTIGAAAMLLGGWAFVVHWVPSQTIYFNIVYVEVPQLAIIVAGWIGIHAADGRHVK